MTMGRGIGKLEAQQLGLGDFSLGQWSSQSVVCGPVHQHCTETSNADPLSQTPWVRGPEMCVLTNPSPGD